MPMYYHFNKQGDFLGTKESPNSDELLSMPLGDLLILSGDVADKHRTMWMRSSSMELHESWSQAFPYNFEKDVYGKIYATLLVMGVDKLWPI